MKCSDVIKNYFHDVIEKSWTWKRLTEEEQKRFANMDVFDRIKGNDETRIEWLCTIYESYIEALGYKPIGWREPKEEKEMPRF